MALTLVAATLCASRIFTADGSQRADNRLPCEKLVSRLTRSFSRTVSHHPLAVQRMMVTPPAAPIVVISTRNLFRTPVSPRQFSLPPPLI